MKTFRSRCQHTLNPLNFACTISRYTGLPYRLSLCIAGTIGGLLRPLLYPKRRPA